MLLFSLKGLNNLVLLARKKVRIVSAPELDADPWLLNVANGTVDLRTGELRPHSRADLMSKLIPVAYDPSAQCPLFMRFLYQIMGCTPDASEGALERAERLCRVPAETTSGCCATAKPEKLLCIFYGKEGDNGKTTLLTTIAKALGNQEYATQINIDSLMVDPRGAGGNNATNADLSDLQGARFAYPAKWRLGNGSRLAG